MWFCVNRKYDLTTSKVLFEEAEKKLSIYEQNLKNQNDLKNTDALLLLITSAQQHLKEKQIQADVDCFKFVLI